MFNDSLFKSTYIYIRLCTVAAINSAAHWSCKLTRLYLPSLSCLVLSVTSNIDTVLMYRVPSFLFRLVYIHSANDLLKNRGRLYTPASELSRHGGLTHASVLQTQTHKTNIVVMRVHLMISHHDVVVRRMWITGSTSSLCRCSLRRAAGRVSPLFFNSPLWSGEFIFSMGSMGSFSVALNNTTIWLPKQRSLNVNQHAWRADLMAVLRYERFLERIQELGKHTWKIVDSWCRLV